MECPRCGTGIRVPAEADRNFRAECTACGWGTLPAAPRPEVKEGLYGEERLSRAQSVKFMAAALVIMFLPLVVWNWVVPFAVEHSLEFRNFLGGRPTPHILKEYMAGVAVYLGLAFVLRFQLDDDWPSWIHSSRWQAQKLIWLIVLIPGRWFWMSLQGLVLGK